MNPEDDEQNLTLEPEEQAPEADDLEEVADDADDEAEAPAEESPAQEPEAEAEADEPEDEDDDPAALTGLPEGARARLQRAARAKAAAAAEARRLDAELREAKAETEKLKREIEAERLDGEGMDWDAYQRAKDRVLRGEARVVDGKLVEEKLFDGIPERQVALAAASIRAKVERIDPDLWKRASEATDVPLGGRMVMALAECQHPASVLRALMADPDLARHAASVSEAKRTLIFERHDRPAKKITPPQRVTSAPAPITPTRGSGVPPRDLARMPQQDYEEMMNEMEAREIKRRMR